MCVNRIVPVLSIRNDVGIPFTPNASGADALRIEQDGHLMWMRREKRVGAFGAASSRLTASTSRPRGWYSRIDRVERGKRRLAGDAPARPEVDEQHLALDRQRAARGCRRLAAARRRACAWTRRPPSIPGSGRRARQQPATTRLDSEASQSFCQTPCRPSSSGRYRHRLDDLQRHAQPRRHDRRTRIRCRPGSARTAA